MQDTTDSKNMPVNNSAIAPDDKGTTSQSTEINPVQVTTDAKSTASNEAKTDSQPQIASDNIVNPEIINDVSKTAPAVVQEILQQPVEIVEKRRRGQPTKYNEGMLQKAKKYLEFSLHNKNLPLIEELARICEVDTDTINNWSNEDDNFFGAIKRIKELQKERIILKGFGAKNPTFSIFMLKANHGMIETEKQIQETDRSINVNITREALQ